MGNNGEKICAVVVTFNRKDLLFECLDSLLRQTCPLNSIYLIDNVSTDGTPHALKERGYINEIPEPTDGPLESESAINMLSEKNGDKEVRIHYVRMNENTGGAGGFYEGIKRACEKKNDWLWMMDDDAAPEEDALEKLIPLFKRKDIAALACSVLYPDGEIALPHRGLVDLNSPYPTLQKPLPADVYGNPEIEIDMASLVGILISAKAIEKIGLPIKEFFVHHDDVEYCIRLREVGKIILVTESRIIHREVFRKGIEKTFLGKKALRIPYDNFWLTYYGRRNLVWLAKKYSSSNVDFYLGTLKSILRIVLDVLAFDDRKIRRIVFLLNAYLDGLRGNFDNKKPKKILYG